jgi:dicarboxylate/amino acid:cation (Na+ or H+) symporter, DAACS family
MESTYRQSEIISRYCTVKLWKKMLIGIGLGIGAGVILGPHAQWLKPFGSIFLSLLNMLVVLLVFSSMTVGITSITDMRKLGRVGLKTFLLYLGTTAVAIIFGLVAAYLIHPGVGITLNTGKEIRIHEAPAIFSILVDLVPSNPIGALANGHILQVITFSIFLGLGINFAGEKGKPLIRVLESLSEVMFKMTGMVMNLAPYGVFAMMAWVAGTFGVKVLVPLLKLILAHYVTCLFHLVVVFGGILICMAKVRVIPFFKGMSDAMTLAASTTSSSATLPVSLHCVEENLGVPKRIASFVLPLGSTVNMNGTAIFQGIASVFIAQAYGIELPWSSLLLIVITATLSAIGSAGIPGAGLVTLSIVLTSIGVPLEGIAVVAAVDRVRDIIGTVINILGDAVVAVYVAKSEGELNEERYNSEVYVSYQDAIAKKAV